MHQNAPFFFILKKKKKNIWWGGHAPRPPLEVLRTCDARPFTPAVLNIKNNATPINLVPTVT